MFLRKTRLFFEVNNIKTIKNINQPKIEIKQI